MDLSTGLPQWTAHFGASAFNFDGRKFSYNPNLNAVCGMMVGCMNLAPNCDFDLSQNVTLDFGGPDAPGDSTYYWSLFGFCWNVTTTATPLPPLFTKVISSIDDNGNYGWFEGSANAWSGANILVQVLARQFADSGPYSTQGLQWPAAGFFLFFSLSLSLQNPPSQTLVLLTDGGYVLNGPPYVGLWSLYIWGRNSTGNTVWYQAYYPNNTYVFLVQRLLLRYTHIDTQTAAIRISW